MTRLETTVPPPVWALLVAVVMFGVNRLGVAFSIGAWGRVAGIAAALVGVSVASSGIVGFARAGTTVDPHAPAKVSTLVDTGVYRITRNPMYLGLALVLIGWGLALRDPLMAVAGSGVFVAIITRLQIVPEERALREHFGATYDDFCARTRRWL